MSELQNEDRFFPCVMQMAQGFTCVGFIFGESESIFTVEWTAKIKYVSAQSRYEISPVMDPFLPLEIPIAAVQMFQTLKPSTGIGVSYASYLADLHEQALIDPNGADYFEHSLFKECEKFIDDAEPTFASASGSELTIRQNARYSVLQDTDPAKAAEYLRTTSELNKEQAGEPKTVDKATCAQKVVAVDFRTRTIGKPEKLDGSGDS